MLANRSFHAREKTMRLIYSALVAVALFVPSFTRAHEPKIVTSDVQRFFDVYTKGRGLPTAQELQNDYLDVGTDGLQQFIKNRILSSTELSKYIKLHPDIYVGAEKCADDIKDIGPGLLAALLKLQAVLPDAKIPPVSIVVGRNNSGGTTGPSGVIIGLEVLCRSNWMQSNLDDRFTKTIVHEYGHVQQPVEDFQNAPTLLWAAIAEGGAELVAELAAGEISNSQLLVWTIGHEEEIEERFVASADSRDLNAWLYGGPGTPEKPGDLAYWVGYRICKAYYESHGRTPAALRRILSLDNVHELMASSGWKPGIKFPLK